MFFVLFAFLFLIYWNENLLRKHPVWSKCHFLVIPSSPSLFDEKLSSSNSCVTSDLSIFLEPLVSSSGWKSTTTEQLLLQEPAWAVRKCHWLPEQGCPSSLRPEQWHRRRPRGAGAHRGGGGALGKVWRWEEGLGWAGLGLRRELCPPPGLQLGAAQGS